MLDLPPAVRRPVRDVRGDDLQRPAVELDQQREHELRIGHLEASRRLAFDLAPSVGEEQEIGPLPDKVTGRLDRHALRLEGGGPGIDRLGAHLLQADQRRVSLTDEFNLLLERWAVTTVDVPGDEPHGDR